jgi:phage tail P2-like protein
MSDLLPPNATAAERAISGAVARIGDVPTPIRGVWDADTCPASLLPWLAWAFSVDQWDANWSDAQKRATIKTAVAVHRYKGTIGAVRDAITSLGINCQVQEWFNQVPEGEPYTFRLILDADQESITQSQLERLALVVSSSKNLRSHLDTIVPGATSVAALSLGAFSMTGHEIEVEFGGFNLVSNGMAISDGYYKSNGMNFG